VKEMDAPEMQFEVKSAFTVIYFEIFLDFFSRNGKCRVWFLIGVQKINLMIYKEKQHEGDGHFVELHTLLQMTRLKVHGRQ
jgi:hypothetical protein